MQPRRALGIDPPQAFMHRNVSLLRRHALIFFPDGQVGLVPGERAAFDQRIHIQARAARHDRDHAAAQDILRCSVRQLDIPRDGKRLARVTDIQQMMRHAAALRLGRLGCADVHPAVDLHGIGRDDLGMQPLRQCDR